MDLVFLSLNGLKRAGSAFFFYHEATFNFIEATVFAVDSYFQISGVLPAVKLR